MLSWLRNKFRRKPEPRVATVEEMEAARQYNVDRLIQRYGGRRRAIRAVLAIKRKAERRERRRLARQRNG